MNNARLLVITGLPASGKTTLARLLSERYGVPLIAKDVIKEPLLDVLGAKDAAGSRRLSNASFAVMFALARQILEARCSVVLEGNFRPAEHATALQPVLRHAARVGQVLCQCDEEERIQRLRARATDPARHAGHRDADLAAAAARAVALRSGHLIGTRVTYAGHGNSELAGTHTQHSVERNTQRPGTDTQHADRAFSTETASTLANAQRPDTEAQHAGHTFSTATAGTLAPSLGNGFLSIPGERFLYDGRHFPLDALDAWWRG